MKIFRAFLCFIMLVGFAFAGVTGKIMGTVTDAVSGEPLPGANVLVAGTNFGAATNSQGYYVILNVPPGKYDVIAQYIGFEKITIQNVQIKIDLTQRMDFSMQADVIGLDGVIVEASKKVVEVDVTGSVANISKDEIEALPATTIGEVVSLSPGVTSAYGIRGSSSDEVSFIVDGVVQRDARTNEPVSTIPLSAVQAISVQTGGMDAEYNNVRSGVVNVAMKEGATDHYEFAMNIKGSAPTAKSFGVSPYDESSFWLKPYLNDELCWDGTYGESFTDLNGNGTWDSHEPFQDLNNNYSYDSAPLPDYIQEQNLNFSGWNSESYGLLANDNSNDDLTASAAQQVYRYQHRRNGYIDEWDYNIDMGFGGPVPIVSSALGDMRFYFSYLRNSEEYVIPMATDDIKTQVGMLKVTSNLTPSQKLSFIGMMSQKTGTSSSRGGYSGMMGAIYSPASAVTIANAFDARVFAEGYYSPSTKYDNSYSLKYTNLLNERSSLDITAQVQQIRYETGPMADRDVDTQYEIVPGFYLDEAPFGFSGDYSSVGINGMAMGGAFGTGRDSSEITSYRIKTGYSNQVDEHNQIKAGLEFQYDQLHMDFGSYTSLPSGQYWTEYDQDPFRFIGFIQDKLEFEGLVAVLGLTGQYIDPNGQWYNVIDSSQNDIYSGNSYSSFFGDPAVEIDLVDVPAQFYLSPRLGISHPISDASKLFFNYGHYVQLPAAESMYRIQRYSNGKLITLGNPAVPLAQTISYEIGFDQSFSEEYLIRISAYYKDIVDQQDRTYFTSVDGKADYGLVTANSYEDIRGFEVQLRKVYGEWFTGNLNYEFRVNSWGQFGYQHYYQDVSAMRDYLKEDPNQGVAQPVSLVKSNIDIHTPYNWGPEVAGNYILGNWHCVFIGSFSQGSYITWNPNNTSDEGGVKITNNIRWKDSYGLDMKISKSMKIGKSFSVKLFADCFNLLNIKRLYSSAFYDTDDSKSYYYSLHLPQEVIDEVGDYGNIPGSDNPGDFRDYSVDYVPMQYVDDISTASDGKDDYIYYNAVDGDYYKYENGAYVPEDESRVSDVLKTKAYIDMPNFTSFGLLYPRDIYVGLNISFDF